MASKARNAGDSKRPPDALPAKVITAGAQARAMDVNPRECMFCHDGLPVVQNEPVNLAFISHIEGRNECNDAFEAWKTNMQSDWIGD